jgi:hypothetical protein
LLFVLISSTTRSINTDNYFELAAAHFRGKATPPRQPTGQHVAPAIGGAVTIVRRPNARVGGRRTIFDFIAPTRHAGQRRRIFYSLSKVNTYELRLQ